MATTSAQAFNDGVSSFLNNYIFPAIVAGMATKGVAVTVAELGTMTQTPARTPTPTAGLMPPPIFGVAGVATGVAPKKPRAPAKAKSQNLPTFVQGKTCGYKSDRKNATNYGLYCANPTTDGNTYCDACMTGRAGVKKKIESLGAKHVIQDAAVATNPTATPGIAPGGYQPPVQQTPAAQGQLSVIKFNEQLGLLREPVHNFIVKDAGSGQVVCVGFFNETLNKVVPLTPEQETTAKSMGLIVAQPEAPTTVVTMTPVVATAVPTMPTVTGIPPVPVIPGLAH